MEAAQQVDLAEDRGHCRLRQASGPGESCAHGQDHGRAENKKMGSRTSSISARPASKSQFSSFILFASVIILINLCSFHVDLPVTPSTDTPTQQPQHPETAEIILTSTSHNQHLHLHRHQLVELNENNNKFSAKNYLNYLDSFLEFVKLMFTQPMRLNGRTTRYTLAEARMLGKMAKVWYIKKKIKKLSKKLKKHTIAVPVFTAIPIYEHSYYPQPHVTHVNHGGGHHAAAASSYAPAVAQLASAASAASPLAATAAAAAAAGQQQMAASASQQHQVAYGMSSPHSAASRASAMYHHPMATGSHRIINAYAPSPPLYVDDNGGLYGHYGNAYGRYDGGYHVW